jgi:hypothetical protein
MIYGSRPGPQLYVALVLTYCASKGAIYRVGLAASASIGAKNTLQRNSLESELRSVLGVGR